MTRSAAVIAILLAVLLLLDAPRSGQPGFSVVSAGLVLWAALRTWRRSTWGQIGLCVLGVLLLTWSLIQYFRTLHPWPFLALIGLSAGTLGTGVVGVLLDRYKASGPGEPTL